MYQVLYFLKKIIETKKFLNWLPFITKNYFKISRWIKNIIQYFGNVEWMFEHLVYSIYIVQIINLLNNQTLKLCTVFLHFFLNKKNMLVVLTDIKKMYLKFVKQNISYEPVLWPLCLLKFIVRYVFLEVFLFDTLRC